MCSVNACRDVNEARSGRGQLSWGRGRGQDSIHFYILTPLSVKKHEIFGRFSTALQELRLKTGFSMETLSANTPIIRPATPLDAGYWFCVYTLNRKCNIISVLVTKHFNSTSKTTRPRGQAGRGQGHNCHEAEASNHDAEASFGASRPRPGRGFNIPGKRFSILRFYS